jgi:hypothetical protein
MSQSIPASNASALAPLAVMSSSSSRNSLHVLGHVGEEDLSLAGDLHQPGALTAADICTLLLVESRSSLTRTGLDVVALA